MLGYLRRIAAIPSITERDPLEMVAWSSAKWTLRGISSSTAVGIGGGGGGGGSGMGRHAASLRAASSAEATAMATCGELLQSP